MQRTSAVSLTNINLSVQFSQKNCSLEPNTGIGTGNKHNL
jgi:hypothetical protein